VDVKTHNESIYHKNTNNFAKRIEHVKEQCHRVADAVNETIILGNFPIVLSGDHSSALGTMSGIKAANPEKTIGVIWIDAHADLHSPFTSPSGNIHGMPLAAAMNMDNIAAKINEPGEITAQQWNELKNIGITGSKIIPAHLIYFGLRDFETAEKQIIDQYEILYFEVEETREKGLEFCIQKAMMRLENCDQIYISFDVDSLDCDRVSYGTGTPVPIGFSSVEIKELLARLIATKKVCCVEFTEVNPLLDNKGNKMAETAFEILDQLVVDLMRS
jgi:arginase